MVGKLTEPPPPPPDPLPPEELSCEFRVFISSKAASCLASFLTLPLASSAESPTDSTPALISEKPSA